MSKRIGFATLMAGAALALTGFARASDDLGQPLSLTPSLPKYADAATPPPKPLTALLNMTPLGKMMSDANITATGFIEGSWTYNFSTPDNHTNFGRVFDFEDQSPEMNQFDLAISRAVTVSKDKFDWGFNVELIYGADARLIHSNGLNFYGPEYAATGIDNDNYNEFDLVQAYFQTNLPIGNGIQTMTGKFVTLLGYETINPTTNPLYSHSYLFGFAIPFTNTGSVWKYQINDNWSASLGLVRGWDQTLTDNNAAPSYMGQVTYTNGKLGAIFNFITGPEEEDNSRDFRTVLDGIVTYAVSDQLTLAWNGDYGWEQSNAAIGNDSATWCGMAVYASYKINDMFTLQGRGEFFDDPDGVRGIGSTVEELTLGVNIHPMPANQWLSGLVFRPEFRWDHSSESPFNDGKDENQYTIAGDIIYAF